MDVCLAGALHHLLHADLPLVVPVADVLRDGGVEEDGLLRHDAEVGPDEGQVQVADVVGVHRQLALVQVVEPLDHLNHGGLAAPGLPHQRHLLPAADGEVQLPEDAGVGAGGVGEHPVPGLHVARHPRQLQARAGRAVNLGLAVQDLEYLLGRGECVVDVHQRGERDSDHGASVEDHHGDLEDGVRGQARVRVIDDQPGAVVVAHGVGEEKVAENWGLETYLLYL